MEGRKEYLGGESIHTIYLGGGTPSLLSPKELSRILAGVHRHFEVEPQAELTLEANPDDLTGSYLAAIQSLGFNRLSIGVQSFDDRLLAYFNRSHDAAMAVRAIHSAKDAGFQNISIDLMFGSPHQSLACLQSSLSQALALRLPHLSIYGLTIEENTVFGRWQRQQKLRPIHEEVATEHLTLLMEVLSAADYVQYEISSFCQAGYASRHNSSYWHGAKYLGIGPSAHSYDGRSRQHNIAHNHQYVKAIREGRRHFEKEILTRKDYINEYLLTHLRLHTGIDPAVMKARWGFDVMNEKKEAIAQFETLRLMESPSSSIVLTPGGRLVADSITEQLMI